MEFTDSSDFINKLNNIFNGLIAMPLLIVGFGYLEIDDGSWQGLLAPNNGIIIGMVIALGVLVTFISLKFKKESRKLVIFDDVMIQMTAYFGLARFYYLSVFALSLIAAALLFIFADLVFALVYAFMLFWLSVFRPTLRSLANIFNLKGEQKTKFLNKEPLDK